MPKDEENPKIVISARLPVKDLATALRFMQTEGIVPKSRTDILRRCLEMITSAVTPSRVSPVTSTEQALSVFEKSGFSLQDSEKNSEEINVALEAEDLTEGPSHSDDELTDALSSVTGNDNPNKDQ